MKQIRSIFAALLTLASLCTCDKGDIHKAYTVVKALINNIEHEK